MTALPGVRRDDLMAGLKGAVASEWGKLWSVRSTWWSLGASAILVVAFVLIVGISAAESKANGIGVPPMTPPEVAAGAVFLMGQLGLATLAALSVASEYATGSIMSTLQWVPRRGLLLMAKALVVCPVLFAAGTAVTLIGVAAGIPSLKGVSGPWSAGSMLADALGLGVYLAAAGVIAVGLGAALRSVSGTLACTFLLLLVIPMSLQSTGVEFLLRVADYFPGSAGMALLGGEGPSYGVPVAALVLLGWCAASFALGLSVLRSKDAT